MPSKFLLYFLVLFNGLTTIVAALNLSANVFVLKATRWTSVQVWSLDFPQLWLYYSPLLFPLWFWALVRESDGSARSKIRRVIPPGLRPWLLAAAILALLFGFPFAHVNLSGAPGPELSVLIRHYWQTMVIAGIARPGAIFFCAAGLWMLLRRRGGEATSAAHDHGPAPKIRRRSFLDQNAGRLICGALAAAVLLRIVLAGPAIPRLEDEVAYHIQALIFEAGQTRGQLSGELAATGISAARLGEILQLPYVFFDEIRTAGETAVEGGSESSTGGEIALYFSAHFHGWSALLAGLSFVALKPFANAILMILNCGLFALLVRRSFATESGGEQNDRLVLVCALFLFACAPATLILTGTYMSHVATQTLLLLLFLVHGQIRADRALPAGFAALYVVAVIATLSALIFVRLQAAVPALIALVAADLLLIAANVRGSRAASSDSRFSSLSAGLRMGSLAIAAVVSLLLYDLYARSLGSDDWFFTRAYLHQYFEAGCQAIGWGPGHGCFPTYGSLGHSFRKFLLNGFDRVSELNHELSPAGLPLLPIALLLAIRHWRKLVDPRQAWLKFALAFLGATGVYSLYFHNGGESYRGRYVFEAVFAFYLVFAKLATLELQAWFKTKSEPAWRERLTRVLLILTPVILITNAAFTIRGDYFSRFIQPYANVNEVAPHAQSALPLQSRRSEARIEDTLIGTRDLVEQLGERDESSGDFYYPLEFQPGERASIPLSSMKAFLNLGYPTLAATATRLDEYGLLRDSDDNVLVGAATPDEMHALARFLRIQKTRRLEYRLPETDRIRRGLVRWILHPPEIKALDTAGDRALEKASSETP
ncbi:MAG: hypothetical protein NXI24_06865 [bacterium]|nr:hypothetical protein [bacterium]